VSRLLLLSFRAWIPICFAVNYKHPADHLYAAICIPRVNQIRVNQSECKRLRLLPRGFNASKIHTVSFIERSRSSHEYWVYSSRYDSMRSAVICDYKRSNGITFVLY